MELGTASPRLSGSVRGVPLVAALNAHIARGRLLPKQARWADLACPVLPRDSCSAEASSFPAVVAPCCEKMG